MGNRLSKLYTRTGDDGTSGLADGSRIAKNHPRMQAIGSVDELNSTIGMLISQLPPSTMVDMLTSIQHDLFNIGGELSMPEHRFICAKKVEKLEQHIDEYNQQVSPLKDFILPGGVHAASICHMARAISRRAERDLITLHQAETVNQYSRQYLNRISDLLFASARIINKENKVEDILWKKELY